MSEQFSPRFSIEFNDGRRVQTINIPSEECPSLAYFEEHFYKPAQEREQFRTRLDFLIFAVLLLFVPVVEMLSCIYAH